MSFTAAEIEALLVEANAPRNVQVRGGRSDRPLFAKEHYRGHVEDNDVVWTLTGGAYARFSESAQVLSLEVQGNQDFGSQTVLVGKTPSDNVARAIGASLVDLRKLKARGKSP